MLNNMSYSSADVSKEGFCVSAWYHLVDSLACLPYTFLQLDFYKFSQRDSTFSRSGYIKRKKRLNWKLFKRYIVYPTVVKGCLNIELKVGILSRDKPFITQNEV